MLRVFQQASTHVSSLRLMISSSLVLTWGLILLVSLIAVLLMISLVTASGSAPLIDVSGDLVVRAIPLIAAAYLVGLLTVAFFSSMPQRIGAFTIAFGLRVLLAIFLTWLIQYDDERGLHIAGVSQVYGLLSLEPGRGYYHWLNLLYTAFGPNLILPKVVNALVGALLPIFAYDIARKLFDDARAGWRAFLMTAFLPPLLLYSALNLKEIATAFLFVLILWFLVIPRHKRIWTKAIGIACSMMAIYWLRGIPWTFVGVSGVAGYLFLGKILARKWFTKPGVWLQLGLLAAAGFFIVYPLLIEPALQIVYSRITVETYYVERFTQSDATVNRFLDTSNPLSLQNLTILFFRGIFFPSPVRFLVDHGISTILESLVMMSWFAVVPFAIGGFWEVKHKSAAVAGATLAMAALSLAILGTMVGSDIFRHRVTMMGLMFIFAGGGLKYSILLKYQWLFYIWWLGIIISTLLWLMLRLSLV